MIKKKKIIIWDLQTPPNQHSDICLWNKRSSEFFSIINYIDRKPKQSIKNLLNYFHKIANANFFSKSLRNYFIFYKKFSYYDLSFFVEKSFYKNNFLEILKAFALIDIIKKKNIRELKVFSMNRDLNKFLKVYCSNNKILFTQMVNKSQKITAKNFISIFLFFKSLIEISIFLYRRFSFVKKNKFSSNKNIIFSYSENIVHKNLKFRNSKYWFNIFQNDNSDFVNIFIPGNKLNTLNKLIKLQQFSNEMYLDKEINLQVLYQILKNLFNLFFKNIFFLLFFKNIFFYKNLPMWFFIKDEWKKSFSIFNIFVNLYYFFLIEKKIKFINNPKKCYYLMENQPWERALCFFWKKNFKQKIIGVCHTPLRFWDLRYKNITNNNNKYYRPDCVVLNGKHSYQLFKKEFSLQKKIKLEPLRYFPPKKIKNNNKYKKTVVIVGDYLHDINLKIVESLEKISDNFYFNYVYLPHPSNHKIIISAKLNLITILNKKKLRNYNTYCFIIPHMSSSALDFHLLSKKIIIFLDDSMPNLSPLYPGKILQSAHDFKSLQNALERQLYSNNIKNIYSYFFYTSKNVKKWKHFIKS